MQVRRFGSRCLARLAALLLSSPVLGSTLFDGDTVLEVTLEGPVSAVIADKRDRDERPFTLTIDGTSFPVDVRVRGNSRVVACAFPPLRLDFDKSELEGTMLEGEDKLKLVTHCRNGNEQAQDSVLNEYAAYRLFRHMSDRSYRVRLLKVRYEDSDGNPRGLDEPHYGFLIESDEGLAKRLGGSVVEVEGIRFSELDLEQAARMSVFQYFIGNKDWSFVTSENDDVCCHNIDLLEVDGQLVTIPYDFDLAAITRARYRTSGRMTQSKRREYAGYCQVPAERLASVVDELLAAKTDLLATVREVPALDERTSERRMSFTEGFFDEAEDRERLLAMFDKRCIGAR